MLTGKLDKETIMEVVIQLPSGTIQALIITGGIVLYFLMGIICAGLTTRFAKDKKWADSVSALIVILFPMFILAGIVGTIGFYVVLLPGVRLYQFISGEKVM